MMRLFNELHWKVISDYMQYSNVFGYISNK